MKAKPEPGSATVAIVALRDEHNCTTSDAILMWLDQREAPTVLVGEQVSWKDIQIHVTAIPEVKSVHAPTDRRVPRYVTEQGGTTFAPIDPVTQGRTAEAALASFDQTFGLLKDLSFRRFYFTKTIGMSDGIYIARGCSFDDHAFLSWGEGYEERSDWARADQLEPLAVQLGAKLEWVDS